MYASYETLMSGHLQSAAQAAFPRRWPGEPLVTNLGEKWSGVLDYIFVPLVATVPSVPHTTLAALSEPSTTVAASLAAMCVADVSAPAAVHGTADDVFLKKIDGSGGMDRPATAAAWKLLPRALWQLPDIADLTSSTALPNEVHASDHVPLAVRFELVCVAMP